MWWFIIRDTNVDTTSQTTSEAPTAQSGFTEGDDREAGSTESNNAIVTDNNGDVGNTPDQNQWTTSPSGQITVYTPAQNATVKSGDKITGASKLSRVSFRLIDNINGEIAKGSISVVNGKFSGTFNFSTNANEGRLDVFGTNSDGTEFSNIEIPVRF